MNYSISSGTLSWWDYNPKDTINFIGTSSEIAGTWTRTKNADASCKPSESEGRRSCKEGYDIIKMVFDNNTVKITRDYCNTDKYIKGSEMDGGTVKIIDCDTYELHNGTDKIRIKETETYGEISYKGKTCVFDESKVTEAQREAACKEAWDTRDTNDDRWYEKYHNDILMKDFIKCIGSITLPAWFN